MRWSFRIGRAFGIPVYLHVTFVLLLGFVAVARMIEGGLLAAAGAVLLICSVFALVVLHELGHALAARRFGIGTRDVTLLPFGGLARLDRMPREPRHELWIALAGPAVNLILAGLLAIPLALTGFAGTVGIDSQSFLAQLVSINLVLFAFNMLPAFPMDGGRVLRALLARRLGRLPATEIAVRLGKGMALLFGFVGLLWNPMLLLIAVFVWFGGNQELELARLDARPAWGWYGGLEMEPRWPLDTPRPPRPPRVFRIRIDEGY